MAADVTRLYLIDTNVLEHIRRHSDSDRIYREIGRLAQRGIVKTVEQVMGELNSFGTTKAALEKHEVKLRLSNELQYHAAVSEKMELVKLHASFLWEQTGSKDPADPWLVAVGAALTYTVVTDEGTTSPRKIPAACANPALNVRCISGPHFLIETGIVTEINPAHLDPNKFWEIDQYGKAG